MTKINILYLFCCIVCPSGQFPCQNGRSFNCISYTDVCDGMQECVDENGSSLDENYLCGGTYRNTNFIP